MKDVCSGSEIRSLKPVNRSRRRFSICRIPNSRDLSASRASAPKTLSSMLESLPMPLTISANLSAFSRRLIRPSVQADIISGNAISLAVCPEGAVSNTIRSYSLTPSSTTSAIRSRIAASCMPGASLDSAMCLSTSLRILTGISRCRELVISSICSFTVSAGSSSITSSPAVSFMALEPMEQPNRCPRLCAGSVETSKTLRPAFAITRAVAADTVVFPTPPLPPKKSIFFARASSSSN